MSTPFVNPRWMPCAVCGASVPVREQEEHVCDPERRLDYEIFQLREEVAQLATAIERYFDSAQGRFERWCAERERRGTSGQEAG